MITQSEKIDEIIPALILARGKVVSAKKREASHYGKYADLAEIIECSLTSILENDLFISQHPTMEDGIDFLKTQISHKSGQFICSYTKIINGRANDPQAQGSAITYARRYGYEALLNIQRADDDGEGAMPKDGPAEKEQSQPNSKPTENKPPPPASGGKKVTKSQAGLLWHKFSEAGFSQEDIEDYCSFHYQAKDNHSLPMSAVKVILGLFDNNELLTIAKQSETDDIPF